MKMYELTQNYTNVLEMIEEGDTETLRDTLESIEEAIEDKAENLAKIIVSFNAECEAIKLEEKRLADRRRTLETKVTGLKQYLQEQLEYAGLTKVKRPTITVAIQKNPPSVEIADESLVPEHYLVEQKPKVDRKTIMQHLKDGQTFEWAALKQSSSLRVK